MTEDARSESLLTQVATTRTYAYDALGRMSAIEESTTRAAYSYGPSGMREIKTIASAAGTTTVTDSWLGQTLVAEKVVTPTSSVEYRYLYGPDALPLELRVKKGGGAWASYAIQCDAGGSVTGITDSTGVTVARYAYDPWGEPIPEEASSSDALVASQPLRYRGYYLDAETGHYYLPARYYDPALGRFLSVDPAPPTSGEPMSLNRYVYCVDSPVMATDGTGERPDHDGDGKVSQAEAAIYASTKTKDPATKAYLYNKGMSDYYSDRAQRARSAAAHRAVIERAKQYAEKMKAALAILEVRAASQAVGGNPPTLGSEFLADTTMYLAGTGVIAAGAVMVSLSEPLMTGGSTVLFFGLMIPAEPFIDTAGAGAFVSGLVLNLVGGALIAAGTWTRATSESRLNESMMGGGR